jgi:hypothetical protein
MQLALTLHPESECPAVERIEVAVTRPSPGILDLRYRLTGALSALALPPLAPPNRADELWRHTCFEAFVRAGAQGYRELNFAPSSQWAAYRFDSYREGMANADPDALTLYVSRGGDAFELSARVTLDLPAVDWQLGLSAVIEATDGTKSYWALAHAPGKPDFHHPDSFALQLPAETAP